MHPMEQAAFIVVCGFTLPARLTRDGARHIASSLDWMEARAGESECDALRELATAIQARMLQAVADSRAAA
jgi:hypothetical protein